MQREALSNIEVLIVGAGLGGLVAAIECYRQGHSPRVVESRNEAEGVGECVVLQSCETSNPGLTVSPSQRRRLSRHRTIRHQSFSEMASNG